MFPTLPSRTRRSVFSLQLTAMIDIFALIIIYLIKGTFFGAADVQVPKDMRLPTSFSKESLETAPTAVIAGNEVRLSILSRGISLNLFGGIGRESDEGKKFRKELRALVDGLPVQATKAGVLLSIVADAQTPYRQVFDVVRTMREAGFEAMLFIASGPES